MGNLYVRSGAAGANNGTSWADAWVSFASAGNSANNAPGDVIWVAHDHVENPSTAQTYTFDGTVAAPCQIYCVNDTANYGSAVHGVPTADKLSTGAQIVGSAAAATLTLAGSVVMYGLLLSASGGSGNASLIIANTTAVTACLFDTCTLRVAGSAGGAVAFGGSSATQANILRFKNCNFRVNDASSRLSVGRAVVIIEGGTYESGASEHPTSVFTLAVGNLTVSGFDMSALPAGTHMIAAQPTGPGFAVFDGCRLPAGWSGSLWSTAPTSAGSRAEMRNCSGGDVHHAFWAEDSAGKSQLETTIVRTNGATDGVQAYSLKIQTSAMASYPMLPFEVRLPAPWAATAGAPKTLSAHFIVDNAGAALKQNEAWLRVKAALTSGTPLSGFAGDDAGLLAASGGADQAASAEAWPAATTPTKQQASVTLTPQEIGYMVPVFCVAKPSTTVYVCPKVEVA